MKSKMKKIIFIIGIVLVVALLGYAIYTFFFDNKENTTKNGDKEPVNAPVNNQVENEKKLEIIDLDSNSRPYAVMVNNIAVARKYHSGLQDAYVVYEMPVEGGITRLMALYKDKDTSRIGSVRSSRHYYLDYALEHDAIYVHFGWSKYAESDMSTLGVNNINGLYDNAFWRDKDIDVAYEHTAFTSMEKIKANAKTKGYRTTTTEKLLLNYSVEEVDLSTYEDAKEANKLDIKYSNYITTNYVYNKDEKVYYRNINGASHNDYVTKKQYTVKNIIVAYIDSEHISGDTSGRLNLKNVGDGEGYYITNGYMVPITWTKSTRKAKTIYKTKDGKEINVNDGNTFIQNAPSNSLKVQ